MQTGKCPTDNEMLIEQLLGHSVLLEALIDIAQNSCHCYDPKERLCGTCVAEDVLAKYNKGE